MTFRTEKKVRINSSKIYDLTKWIDENDGFQLYPKRVINSIYFDTSNYSMYSDSMEGVLPRKKIRLRNYNYKFIFDKNVKKEIKISSVEGRFKTSSLEKNPYGSNYSSQLAQRAGLAPAYDEMTPGMQAAADKGMDARMGRTYQENIQAMADPRMLQAKGGLAKILGV